MIPDTVAWRLFNVDECDRRWLVLRSPMPRTGNPWTTATLVRTCKTLPAHGPGEWGDCPCGIHAFTRLLDLTAPKFCRSVVFGPQFARVAVARVALHGQVDKSHGWADRGLSSLRAVSASIIGPIYVGGCLARVAAPLAARYGRAGRCAEG